MTHCDDFLKKNLKNDSVLQVIEFEDYRKIDSIDICNSQFFGGTFGVSKFSHPNNMLFYYYRGLKILKIQL